MKFGIRTHYKRKIMWNTSNSSFIKALKLIKNNDKKLGILTPEKSKWFDRKIKSLKKSIKNKTKNTYYHRKQKQILFSSIVNYSGSTFTKFGNKFKITINPIRKPKTPKNIQTPWDYKNYSKMDDIIQDMGGLEAAVNDYLDTLIDKADFYDLSLEDYLYTNYGFKLPKITYKNYKK